MSSQDPSTFPIVSAEKPPPPPVTSSSAIRDEEIIATKQCRVEIDKALQNVRQIGPSRETSLAVTKLQEAVMWLGMNLKRLNEPNPYPSSYDATNTKIEPTADGLKL